MEDGQVASEYAPNRSEDDPEDLEYHGDFPSSESKTEDESSDESTDAEEPAADADTKDADPGAAAQGGTRDPLTPTTSQKLVILMQLRAPSLRKRHSNMP